jgi:hypothetical protein
MDRGVDRAREERMPPPVGDVPGARFDDESGTSMTTDNASGDASASGPTAREPLTVRSVILRHKVAWIGGIALLFVLVALMAATVLLGSSAGALSDSSTCSEWSSASQAQQNAYSHLYVNEYGALLSIDLDAVGIESAINRDCTRAAYLGESDDLSIYAAITHHY